MDLWRLTSIILKTEAPFAAAEVRKPDRNECPEKALASKPILRAISLMMLATERDVSLARLTRAPLSIGRNSAPLSIPAALTHARNPLTGQATVPRVPAIVAPTPSWSVFDRRMSTRR